MSKVGWRFGEPEVRRFPCPLEWEVGQSSLQLRKPKRLQVAECSAAEITIQLDIGYKAYCTSNVASAFCLLPSCTERVAPRPMYCVLAAIIARTGTGSNRDCLEGAIASPKTRLVSSYHVDRKGRDASGGVVPLALD